MNTKVLCLSMAVAAFSGCVCTDQSTCKCPYGTWAMFLPYETMNAGHLILEKNDGKAEGLLLWRWGSPFKVEQVSVGEGTFKLEFGDHKPKDLPPEKFAALRRTRIEARVCGSTAKCVYTLVDGNGKVVDGPREFVARRNPPIGPKPNLSSVKWGEPINLLAGTKDDFALMEEGKVDGWTLKDGVLSNRILRDKDGKWLHKNGNLRTKRADFVDFKLSYDVRVPKDCNSGVYLRGLYEIQTLDSYGKPVDCHNMAACYGRLVPRVSAEKPAGEWQHVDVILVQRHLTVVLNGVTLYDNEAIPGITGGAMTADEFAPGPIYLQGDHSDADYRNMILTPVL